MHEMKKLKITLCNGVIVLKFYFMPEIKYEAYGGKKETEAFQDKIPNLSSTLTTV